MLFPKMLNKRKFLFTSLLALLVVASTTVLVMQSTDLLIKKSPLAEAAAEIKINGSLAYLWFDEIVSGDTTQSIQEVWYYLEIADWHVGALLDGGESIMGSYQPISDPELRERLMMLRQTLAEFRQYAGSHYQQSVLETPSLGLKTDEYYLDFASQADEIQRVIKTSYESGIASYTKTSITLIIAAVFIGVYSLRVQFKHEQSRDLLLKSLTDAKSSIELKNKQLHTQAYFDPLTELPNRTLFLDRLGQSILNAQQTQRPFALLFLDLDHFKEVNDLYGHAAGDELLKQVAQRITQSIRVTDLSARFSGDEFVIVLEHLRDVDMAVSVANKIASKLIKRLREPFELKHGTAEVTASIGISIYPDDSTSQHSLIRYADDAMYHAKSLGKNNFQFYSKELNYIAMSQKELERDLRQAIDKQQFEIHYLPKWALKSGDVEGVEALVRWKHPIKGLMYPNDFIPVAEATGQIRQIDLLVAELALAQHKNWLTRGIDIGVMSLNISARSLKHPQFFDALKRVIISSGVATHRIEVEITETVMIENDQFAQIIFKELHQLGVRIALDDFGTGFSSLSYLKDFEFDTLKIDRSFVMDYVTNSTSLVLLKSMIQIGNELGVAVIAEGVETLQQQRDLMSMGCEIGQGFYLTSPQTADRLIENLKLNSTSNVVPMSGTLG